MSTPTAAQKVPSGWHRPCILLRYEAGSPQEGDSPRTQDNWVQGRDHTAPELEAGRTKPHPWLRKSSPIPYPTNRSCSPGQDPTSASTSPATDVFCLLGTPWRVLQLAQDLSISVSSLGTCMLATSLHSCLPFSRANLLQSKRVIAKPNTPLTAATTSPSSPPAMLLQ